MIWTLARVGSFLSLAQGRDIPPAAFVPGQEVPETSGQDEEEQKMNLMKWGVAE